MPPHRDDSPPALPFAFDNSYARDLPGCYVPWQPAPVAEGKLLFLNASLAGDLGLDLASVDGASLAAVFSGSVIPAGAEPIAQAYAGHQFGRFSPQLGDGRAVLLGEVVDRRGARHDIAFKGSGRTPFSRRGDGQAALGPMLREAIMGEAMHALGIPSTRALAVVGTNQPVLRERALPGAVLTRVAASHLRVGTFEYFAARGEHEQVRKLADYSIARHYPELANEPGRHLEFLRAVIGRQAELVARWMGVGFIHGVMNT
ncbi:MAG TPA: protein adenylyltransferase SelO family protein, partial [Rhodocyclaceae bacterium]|nr:protein adenylyltransferase SelO family protein [Rhodocyclaceae bacterium]